MVIVDGMERDGIVTECHRVYFVSCDLRMTNAERRVQSLRKFLFNESCVLKLACTLASGKYFQFFPDCNIGAARQIPEPPCPFCVKLWNHCQDSILVILAGSKCNFSLCSCPGAVKHFETRSSHKRFCQHSAKPVLVGWMHSFFFDVHD